MPCLFACIHLFFYIDWLIIRFLSFFLFSFSILFITHTHAQYSVNTAGIFLIYIAIQSVRFDSIFCIHHHHHRFINKIQLSDFYFHSFLNQKKNLHMRYQYLSSMAKWNKNSELWCRFFYHFNNYFFCTKIILGFEVALFFFQFLVIDHHTLILISINKKFFCFVLFYSISNIEIK